MTSIIGIFIIFLIASCYCEEFSSAPRNFSLELMYFTHLDHFAMSPYSIWNLLVFTCLGGAGRSNRQIQEALRIPISRNKLFRSYHNLSITIFEFRSNGVDLDTKIFIFQDQDMNILSSYRDMLSASFDAETHVLNFQDTMVSANLANNYVQYWFPSIFNVFHADDFIDTTMILSNVIHFRGKLSIPFNNSDSYEEVIYNENKKAVGSVTMMHHKGKLPYSDFESMNSHILELPYGDDGKFSMLIILPHEGVNPIDVYKKLSKIYLRGIFDKLEKDANELGLKNVDVKLPRFRIRSSLNLHKPLNKMGVYDGFDPKLSDFNGISSENLYINTIEQKTDIIFTETETVAFSTTPGYFDHDRPSSNLKTSQPFIFFLMEKPTATVIFGGMYSKHRQLNDINSHITFNNNN